MTGVATGMGALYGNGYTAAVIGAGTPVISADGTTITFTIDSMPAMSGFAFQVAAVPDGSYQQLVLDTLLTADVSECVIPTPTPTPVVTPPAPTATPTPIVRGPLVQTDGPDADPLALVAVLGLGLTGAAALLRGRRTP